MLHKEFQFFKDHQKELVDQHRGKVLVIIGEDVVGVFETPFEAYLDSISKYKPGSFMIQVCNSGPEAYTVTINTESISRVYS